MTVSLEFIQDYLKERLGDKLSATKFALNELTLEVPVGQWLEVCRFLRHNEMLDCAQLTDLCGVDYLTHGDAEWDVTTATRSGFSRAVQANDADPFDFGEEKPLDVAGKRFAVVVHLLSVSHNLRIRIRTWCEDNDFPVVPSLVDIWSSANWYEREAFDLFGIMFTGHPDLRRILTDYGFVGHPFRKDFPLIGQVEMRYDAEQRRVVYEPVSIDPRVLVPRTIRHDQRFSPAEEHND
ncbi:NADH-quinone oxidoreductase subunit C [Candidatus Thiothrix sp. Deng01]|uniref:NADH-quinone oxidoreductase subunit C n=2 Tax=Thiothrix TaxID=1030 RepID=A0A7L6AUZ9_9GAMM|nr:NADH-quinone oxidoreductase subunit C [Candidatus Thiothrix sp. Deng01]MEB4592430.1 NADH-quinone oxidoreductase subunit C [Candidatus Thiothrix sp. Deng01]QLQ32909.1 MAG: NADH-quinone oxidoreductase subunit C [Candidatus Thiothrix singaporensis]